MFMVGVSIGADRKIGEIIRSINKRILLLPLITTMGTFAGVGLASGALGYNMAEAMAIGAGFGYYSLSSILIGNYMGAEAGAMALMSNILRELFVLLCAPFLYRYFGPVALICSGGCTTSDTTLPVIVHWAGSKWVAPAIIHAMLLDFSVPFWVAFFCSLAK